MAERGLLSSLRLRSRDSLGVQPHSGGRGPWKLLLLSVLHVMMARLSILLAVACSACSVQTGAKLFLLKTNVMFSFNTQHKACMSSQLSAQGHVGHDTRRPQQCSAAHKSQSDLRCTC